MAKIRFKLLPPPMEEFQFSCSERISVKDVENVQTPKNPNSFVCKLITERSGHLVFTQPRMCAQCQPTGEVRMQFVNDQVGRKIGVALTHVRMGFYSVDESRDILKLAYEAAKGTFKGRESLRWLVEHLVGTGKMPLAFASEMVTQDLPDLETKADEDELLKKAATGTGQQHIITVDTGSPAKNGDQSSDSANP